jgi:hypothetical protein
VWSARQQIFFQVQHSLIFLGNVILICKSLSHKSTYITHYKPGVHSFPEIYELFQDSRRQMGDTNNCRNEDLQILCSTVRCLVITAIWLPEFAHKFRRIMKTCNMYFTVVQKRCFWICLQNFL